MVNNAERPDPSRRRRPLRSWRPVPRPVVALDEGRAWRRRRDGVLAVLRVEVYASADDRATRSAWRTAGEAALEETWRERWLEREASARLGGGAVGRSGRRRVRARSIPERVDWLHLEDHTEAAQHDAVMAYEHLVVWLGRAQATLTIRHVDGLDLDDVVAVGHRLAPAEPPPAR